MLVEKMDLFDLSIVQAGTKQPPHLYLLPTFNPSGIFEINPHC
jgi:hypothetical protein